MITLRAPIAPAQDSLVRIFLIRGRLIVQRTTYLIYSNSETLEGGVSAIRNRGKSLLEWSTRQESAHDT